MYLVKRDTKDPHNSLDESEELTSEQRKNSYWLQFLNKDKQVGKNIKFVNSTEKENYQEMIKNIKEKGNVRAIDIMSIVNNFWKNRARFSSKVSFA